MGYQGGTSRLREWLDSLMLVGAKTPRFHHYVIEVVVSQWNDCNEHEQILDCARVMAIACAETPNTPIGQPVEAMFNNDEVADFIEEMKTAMRSPLCRLHLDVLPSVVFALEPIPEEFPYRVEISSSALDLSRACKLLECEDDLTDLLTCNNRSLGIRFKFYIANMQGQGSNPQEPYRPPVETPKPKQNEPIEVYPPHDANPLDGITPPEQTPDLNITDLLNQVNAHVNVLKDDEKQDVATDLLNASKKKVDELIEKYAKITQDRKASDVENRMNSMKFSAIGDEDFDAFDETEDVNSSTISISEDADEDFFDKDSPLPVSRTTATSMANPQDDLLARINALSSDDQHAIAAALRDSNRNVDAKLLPLLDEIQNLPTGIRTSMARALSVVIE